MTLVKTLIHELSLREDIVQAVFDKLSAQGVNTADLELLVKHSLEIGIIKDKLENIKMNEILEKADDDEVTV